ncbi:unnamed protein product [Caenorhabditis auriculariae]|uniref:Uncharacterized protein n=1 Tax=Caenorhabditis auriculariae TaxID=2777116 RepID=A0A8S1HZ39_9PELO|nr:unnamed protein product [Caenorhabditis auriculariae]
MSGSELTMTSNHAKGLPKSHYALTVRLAGELIRQQLSKLLVAILGSFVGTTSLNSSQRCFDRVQTMLVHDAVHAMKSGPTRFQRGAHTPCKNLHHAFTVEEELAFAPDTESCSSLDGSSRDAPSPAIWQLGFFSRNVGGFFTGRLPMIPQQSDVVSRLETDGGDGEFKKLPV